MADLNSEYLHYGARVTFDNAFAAEHGWESPDGELPCGTAASPYMIACSQNGQPYDSEQKFLSLFLGNLSARNGGALRGSLMRFDQTEFGAGAANSMDTNGTVFGLNRAPRAPRAASSSFFTAACRATLRSATAS
jgi:hypothetical protein